MNVRSSFDEGATWRDHANRVDNAGVRIDDDHTGYDVCLIAPAAGRKVR
ncbi:hypothetical protein [Streptosporangium sp. NPDC000396]